MKCIPIRIASSARETEKRAVLRKRKEALSSPVNKVDRVEKRNWFQIAGQMIAKVPPRLSHRSPRSRDKEIVTVK